MNSENLNNQGGITGEDKGDNAKENSWESQAKYFQSEKDKLFQENQRLKKYEKLGKALKARPDIVNAVKEKLNNVAEPSFKRPENFDPWEAYNDPKSESYKFRVQEMEHNINSAVQKKVKQETVHIEEQQAMQGLENELRQRGMGQEQIKDFIEFADTDPSEFGIDGVLKMYNAYKDNNPNAQEDPLSSIKRTQNNPAVGGILNGEMPKATSDDEDMWKGIVGANKVGNKLP